MRQGGAFRPEGGLPIGSRADWRQGDFDHRSTDLNDGAAVRFRADGDVLLEGFVRPLLGGVIRKDRRQLPVLPVLPVLPGSPVLRLRQETDDNASHDWSTPRYINLEPFFGEVIGTGKRAMRCNRSQTHSLSRRGLGGRIPTDCRGTLRRRGTPVGNEAVVMLIRCKHWTKPKIQCRPTTFCAT